MKLRMIDLNIVYMGTPDFAVPALRYLCENGFNISGVFTQPDKPKGRKAVLTPPPVKEYAQSRGICVYQPVSFKDGQAEDTIRALAPDLIVVAAYGKILPQSVLDIPPLGSVCLHGSILPRYRGAAPIQRAVINGEKTTGITAMLMDAGIDTGDILLKKELEIGEDETAGELFERLAALSVDVLRDTLAGISKGELTPIKQDESLATYSPLLSKADSAVDLNESAQNIHNLVRGLNPWPSAVTEIGGVRVKLHKTALTGAVKGEGSGYFSEDNRLYLLCGDKKVLEILELQPDGGKRMSASDYLRGHKI